MRVMHRLVVSLAIGVPVLLAGCATTPPTGVGEKEEATVLGLVTTQRSAPLRYAPSFAAPVLQTVPANASLLWLDNQQRNGFYRVAGKDKGHPGWILAADVRVVQAKILTGFAAFAACATRLDQCSENGCAADGTPDALSNTLKHHVPS